MQIKSRAAVVLILGIFWGVIGISMVTGTWQTKATSEEVVVNSPGDIKGWMTLTDVSQYFKVPVPKLTEIFGLPADIEPDKQLKEIAEDSGKEVDDLRGILDNYLGVQTETSNSNAADSPVSTQDSSDVSAKTASQEKTGVGQSSKETLPVNQAKPVKPQGGSSGATSQTTQPVTQPVTQPAKEAAPQSAEAPKNSEGDSGDEQAIKGKMTLSEVEFVTKVPAAYICQQLGIPETTDKGTALRDLGQQYGFEVDSIRDIVTKYKP